MKSKYKKWIADYVASVGGDVLQKCGAATAAMVLDFPELKRVRGHVRIVGNPDHILSMFADDGDKTRWPHWWCVDPDGIIIDPTAKQFPGIEAYEPFDESLGEPVGRCIECGAPVYKSSGRQQFCGSNCEDHWFSRMGYVRGKCGWRPA